MQIIRHFKLLTKLVKLGKHNLSEVMKKSNLVTLAISAVLLFTSHTIQAQFNTIKYVSEGYFNDLNMVDSLMIETPMLITISQNKVEILAVDPDDAKNDKMFFESRCMSALKYPATNGEFYYIWKLGDRKMVLRVEHGTKYLSLYKTNEFGLPAEYLTFKIKG